MAHHIGSMTVTSTGTSGITAGVVTFSNPVDVQQSSDGSNHLQVGGQGQGAANDAVPIQPRDREPAPVLVSGLDIEMLSEKLGRDYARLGPRLGISSAEMEYLELDCSRTSYQHVTRNMLQKWCKSVGPDATRVNLSEKLRAIQRVDLATELLQL